MKKGESYANCKNVPRILTLTEEYQYQLINVELEHAIRLEDFTKMIFFYIFKR